MPITFIRLWICVLTNKSFDIFSYFPDNVNAELQNWKNVSKNSKETEERRRANTFIRAIEPIVEEIKALETFRLKDMEDSANSILGCIDDLWKLDDYKYPQDQMERLLDTSSIYCVIK